MVLEIWERLRLARVAKGLELSDVEDRTRVRVHLLTAIESGRFEVLPHGLYSRAAVRAYADAVGLDPAGVVADVMPLLPVLEDPIDALARARGIEREAPATSNRPPESAAGTLAGIGATLVDSAILASIDLWLLGSSAWLCGVSVERMLRFAGPAIVMLSLLIAGVYFLMFGGVAGVTPGMRLAGMPPVEPGDRRVNLLEAAKRASWVVLREGSIVLELFVRARHSTKAIDPKLAALECERQIE